ncbi:MAG: metalloregulator ArsR/SmtB family transcription factor [Desulfopila sp.]|nr:metalloregulator ArsR/SmtB family transcription factor [Desulfopila sp.]
MDEAFLRSDTEIADTAQMYKALGDVTRLRILGLLRNGELCVCDIMEVLKLPQSTVSRHLAYLRNNGLVSGRRKGKWMYYQLHESVLQKGIRKKNLTSFTKLSVCVSDQIDLQKHLLEKKRKDCL